MIRTPALNHPQFKLHAGNAMAWVGADEEIHPWLVETEDSSTVSDWFGIGRTIVILLIAHFHHIVYFRIVQELFK